jgi:hypothetical protein
VRKLLVLIIVLIICIPLACAEDPPDFGFDDATTEGDEASDQVIETTQVDAEDPEALNEVAPLEDSRDKESDRVVNTEGTYELEGTTSADTTWQTSTGTISNAELTNALFSLGNFIQGSIFSSTTNNLIAFGSTFDTSLFNLILNDEDQAQIAQTNGFGDLGYTYISLTGGNLTQDNTIIFLPEGETPEYIYYNTTDIEFQDGTIYFNNEMVTNTDQTEETSTLQFDENGFTKVQIHANNNYTLSDYTFSNTEGEDIYACKNDAYCEINIENEKIQINSKLNLYYQNELVLESQDNNNQITIEDNILTLTNPNPKEQTLIKIKTSYYEITQQEDLQVTITEENPILFTSYQYGDQTFTLERETLYIESFVIFSPYTPYYSSWLQKVVNLFY